MMTNRWTVLAGIVLIGLLGGFTGCGEGDGEEEGYGVAVNDVDEHGKPTLSPTGWEEPGGKADAMQGNPGLPVEADDSPTAVWEVENQWSDRHTEAARKEGMAWPADSGLSWEEKFHRWVDSMPRIDRDGHGETFLLTTPYGVELPAPVLECAEVAIFLRAAFANWYGLPFFMEARDANGDRVYFGHFGIRTADGRYANMPNFRSNYDDFRHLADAVAAGDESWPTDTQLAGRGLPGANDDDQPMIGDDARTGAYFDEIFLNKRAGYFLLIQLTYFGSINLADPVNTYHVIPEAVSPSDTLLHRWQRTGIGHAMVVMSVDQIGGGEELQLEANVASGSMPRRQPLWENAVSSKQNFTSSRAGGPGNAEYNGGLKRWRVATDFNGYWTNVVPAEFSDEYLSASNTERIAERTDQFDELLTELSDEDLLEAALDSIEQAREHLRLYPSSCVARDNREEAFEDLYEAGEQLGMSEAELDAEYRELEDYVFAPLVYSESKTCCWVSTTSEMHGLIVDYAVDEMEAEDACMEPPVFKAVEDGADGYQRFRQYAEDRGMGGEWVDWSADESCPQIENWTGDVEQPREWTPWCEAG